MIELLVAMAIGVLILSALTSVLLTTYRADQAAINRIEVSGELRNFQQTAYDDFASSALPAPPGGCGTSSQPCTQDAINLQSCALSSAAAPTKRVVAYQWISATQVIQRQVGSITVNSAANNVTAFAWYVDGAAPNQSVVVSLTVQQKGITQSQTMRFYPRVASQMPLYVTSPC